MCCFFAKGSFANVLSAVLFPLISGRNYGQNCLAEWNITGMPKQDGARVRVERLHLSSWRQVSLSICTKEQKEAEKVMRERWALPPGLDERHRLQQNTGDRYIRHPHCFTIGIGNYILME